MVFDYPACGYEYGLTCYLFELYHYCISDVAGSCPVAAGIAQRRYRADQIAVFLPF